MKLYCPFCGTLQKFDSNPNKLYVYRDVPETVYFSVCMNCGAIVDTIVVKEPISSLSRQMHDNNTCHEAQRPITAPVKGAIH